MNIYLNTPYTYRIYWSNTGMNYYGVRYAKDCHPADLFVTYFTSSVCVADHIKKYGLPDIIEIRKTFTSESRVDNARKWESRVLSRLKVHLRTDYLNQSTGKGIPPMPGNKNPMNLPGVRDKHKESVNKPEVKKNKSYKSSELWKSSNYREQQSIARKEAWSNNIDRKLNVATHFSSLWDNELYREIQSNKRKELWQDPEHYAKMVVTRQGKNNGRFDPTIYEFVHVDGITEITTRYDLIEKYKLHKGEMCKVVKNHGTSHRGWKCVGVYGS